MRCWHEALCKLTGSRIREVNSHHILSKSPGGVIPISVHSDGGEIYRSNEYSIYSWSSALVQDINTWDYKFLVCLMPEDLKIKWVTDGEIVTFIIWNIEVMESGIFPSTDHLGRPLTGRRATMAGKPLAVGWRATLTSTLSDLKEKVKAHRYPRNYMCIFSASAA